jgi:tRNA(Ile)-lysidine synthase
MKHQSAQNEPKQSPLLQRFSESLSQLLVRPADKIIVAVSGGADSVCLLHLFLKAGFLASLHVAHLNHGFRAESEQEAVFVAKLCQSWGVPCTVAKRNVLATCKEMRLSKQQGARVSRYAFLQEVAKAQETTFIALGHTADDQVETILINTLRGAGITGQMGIPISRDVGGCLLIRPMLKMTRSEIIAELSTAVIAFVEDPSNQDKRYLRSRVRHELIPFLETYNPRIRKTFLQGAKLSGQENDFIEKTLAEIIPKIDVVIEAGNISFNLSLFLPLHPALQHRLLRWAIRKLKGDLRDIGFEPIETILTAMDKDFTLCLPQGMTAKKTDTKLILAARSLHVKTNAPPEFTIPKLTKEQTAIDLPEWDLRLALSVVPPPLTQQPCSILFDFDTISYPLTVRGFLPGDRFCPLGMKGRHKKLQDFFVDMKVPKEKRNHVPLLVCPAGIVAVIGFRQDERFKVTETTKRILCLQRFI